MSLAPIVLFLYNRPVHTQRTIEALLDNSLANKSDLIIFSDGPKDSIAQLAVDKVRAYIKTIKGFNSIKVIERDVNLGLATSVITGVSEIIAQHGSAIVLEDDLITAPDFLSFMNAALINYKNEAKIFSIAGYNFPIDIPNDYENDVYFFPRGMSWGWATWSDRWEKADWDVKDYPEFKKNRNKKKEFDKGGNDLSHMLSLQMNGLLDSWAIRWCYAIFNNKALCVYPVTSLIQNIGFDGSGTHCGTSEKHQAGANGFLKSTYKFPEKIEIDDRIANSIQKHSHWPILKKCLVYIKRYLNL